MTVAEVPSGTHIAQAWLGGRFRLDEPVSLEDHVSGPCGPSLEARGYSLWKATDQLLRRPVTIYTLPPGVPVPGRVVEAVQAAAKVSDPRLATIYDTDFDPASPYIVAEWAPGTHLEDLVLSGLPSPALAAAMIADAADALAVAHRAGRPHLRLTPRSLRWNDSTGLKITGLGIDAALCGQGAGYGPGAGYGTGAGRGGTVGCGPGAGRGGTADTVALGRMLYALLTGYWPGDEPTALPSAPRYKGRVCTPRQVRAGVPALLDAITYRALLGQAPDAPLRAQTPAGLALALSRVQRPSHQQVSLDDEAACGPARAAEGVARARHARRRGGLLHPTSLLRPAV